MSYFSIWFLNSATDIEMQFWFWIELRTVGVREYINYFFDFDDIVVHLFKSIRVVGTDLTKFNFPIGFAGIKSEDTLLFAMTYVNENKCVVVFEGRVFTYLC